ncbi:SurA N-terminal domain-containing protein [Dichotomicrobium thermohalophilum]|uniref:Parvulin-like PPIase n=1 Tax=Dichotomicrobium thermohalophilum TaxID=933063 RepID=A0A397Q4N6_9HYPH|nr:SurA N-terminal domain-containing protein [Dichotomicrobium thermohalophilum]RIA56450.1 peptidyl-prolyl cis-trans isomerase D [Dichotomicrobium thermohalophilum]
MLDNIRKNASGWLAKILIGLLIVSFAVWGLADQFSGGNTQVLAKVEGQEIPLEQFRQAYQNQINALSRQQGERITTQEAREAGLPDMVLEQIVNAALLDAHARRLGLSVSDEAVTQSVVQNPLFRDASGEFSRAQFERVLQFSNLSEAALLAQERDALVRSQVVETVSQTPGVPDTLVAAMNRYQNETRVITYFNVGPEAIEERPEPTESKLRSYYDDNTDRFLAPETREVAVLDVTPAALVDRVDVTDDQVRADYEARRDQYVQPERRDIQQIVFPDLPAAQAGYEALQSGTDFMAVAKQQGMSEADTELGTLTKADIPDDKIAQAAFALEEGAYSEPVEGSFTTVILKVNEVMPGKSRSYEEVKDEIRQELTERAAAERIIDLRGAIEDERAAGAPLSEIAEKFELPYKTVTLDRSGDAPDGSTAPHPADLAQFREAVFASDVGIDEELIEKPGGGLLWYEVLAINPATERPFAEVKNEVEEAWRADQLRQAIVAKADALGEKARAGKPMEQLAQEVGAELSRTDAIKRNARVSDLSSAAVGRAFTLPREGVATASAPNAPAQSVFKVKEIKTPAPPTGEEAEQLRTALRNGIDNDLAQQYLSGLRTSFDYTVNREVLNQTFGL